MTVQRQIDRLIAHRASEWVQTLKTAGPAEREAFVDWLRESRRHVEEYLTMVALEQEMDKVDLSPAVDRSMLLARIAPEVVALQAASDALTTSSHPGLLARARRQWRRSGKGNGMNIGMRMAASLTAVMLMAFLVWSTFSPAEEFSTHAGEQKSVELADGSVVQLNASSRVRVSLTRSTRALELLHGEALFKVAPDVTRPFQVRTRDAMILALGTQFNVNTSTGGTTVSVLEGKVRLSVDHGPPTSQLPNKDGPEPALAQVAAKSLIAGEAATVEARGRQIRHQPQVDVASAVAWRPQRLTFRQAPLEDVVREFNRHNATPKFRLESVSPTSHHYSATFDADDPESFADLLSRETDLRVERMGSEIVIHGRGVR